MKSNLSENMEIENIILINFVNLTDQEKEMIRDWRNHEDIRKWMYTDHIISPEEHLEFIEKLRTDNKNFNWIIKDKNNDYLGVICLNRVDSRNRNAYFGLYSNPYCKIVGLGRLLDKISIKLAFDVFGLHTLKLEVIEDNKHVINLHKKMGFQEEGILREFVLKGNVWKNIIVMGLINNN